MYPPNHGFGGSVFINSESQPQLPRLSENKNKLKLPNKHLENIEKDLKEQSEIIVKHISDQMTLQFR